MSDFTRINLASEGDHLVEPPIVDLLYFDAEREAYVITFVPEDRVSHREKELVIVPQDSEDGRRINLRLRELARLLGKPVEKIFHKGGGDFGFYFDDGQEFALSDESGSSALTLEAYIHLQDLGMIAQIAFRESQLLRPHRG